MRTFFISMTVVSAAFLMISPSHASPNRYQEPEIIVDLGCDPGLGHLQTIRLDEIEAIDDSYSISIWVVCPGHPDPVSPLAGNVGGLHDAIAQNDALSAALADEGLDAEDVVAIRFGSGNSLIIYVLGSH
jgi:hypothetical protein